MSEFERSYGRYAEHFNKVREQLGLPGDLSSASAVDDTIIDVVNRAVIEHGSRQAFSCMGRSLSFTEIGKLSDQFAVYLQQQDNLHPGDRIAIQLPNILQYPVAVFGALKAGLIVVNTNPLYTPREMRHQFTDSGAKAIVVLANMASKVEDVLADTEIETVIVTEIGDLHKPVKRVLLNFAVKYLKKMVPVFSLPRATSFISALQQGKEDRLKSVSVSPEDVAILQYTGGTTGVAKGAMLTQRNLVSNMLQVNPLITQAKIQAGDIFIAPLPLYHIYAFMLHAMTVFSCGGHSVLISNPRDMTSFVKEISRWPFQAMVGLNTLFVALMNNAQFQTLSFSSLKLTLSGGMALSESVAKEWQSMTGCAVQEGYGLTETSPVVSFNPYGNAQLGTIGIPLTATYIKIIDEKGEECEFNQAGELCVKGPQVMKGYWQRQEATDKTIIDGWLLTGDIAELQEDGYIKIVDRKKDMILVSGFNVYPNELENVINGHPGVLETAAVGIPDEQSGEMVKIFIVKKDPSLTEDEIKQFCKENLTGYKRPKLIEFRADLPKSNVGKILRRELRDRIEV